MTRDESRSVWVVEQGSYSDYRVVGVFTSRKNAKLIADKLNVSEYSGYDKATISKWTMNPAVDELRAGMDQWHVLMTANGDVEKMSRRSFSSYEISGKVFLWERTKAEAYKGKGVPDALDCTVWARDEQHAIK